MQKTSGGKEVTSHSEENPFFCLQKVSFACQLQGELLCYTCLYIRLSYFFIPHPWIVPDFSHANASTLARQQPVGGRAAG